MMTDTEYKDMVDTMKGAMGAKRVAEVIDQERSTAAADADALCSGPHLMDLDQAASALVYWLSVERSKSIHLRQTLDALRKEHRALRKEVERLHQSAQDYHELLREHNEATMENEVLRMNLLRAGHDVNGRRIRDQERVKDELKTWKRGDRPKQLSAKVRLPNAD